MRTLPSFEFDTPHECMDSSLPDNKSELERLENYEWFQKTHEGYKSPEASPNHGKQKTSPKATQPWNNHKRSKTSKVNEDTLVKKMLAKELKKFNENISRNENTAVNIGPTPIGRRQSHSKKTFNRSPAIPEESIISVSTDIPDNEVYESILAVNDVSAHDKRPKRILSPQAFDETMMDSRERSALEGYEGDVPHPQNRVLNDYKELQEMLLNLKSKSAVVVTAHHPPPPRSTLPRVVPANRPAVLTAISKQQQRQSIQNEEWELQEMLKQHNRKWKQQQQHIKSTRQQQFSNPPRKLCQIYEKLHKCKLYDLKDREREKCHQVIHGWITHWEKKKKKSYRDLTTYERDAAHDEIQDIVRSIHTPSFSTT
jgi:hypothetical protein